MVRYDSWTKVIRLTKVIFTGTIELLASVLHPGAEWAPGRQSEGLVEQEVGAEPLWTPAASYHSSWEGLMVAAAS